VLRNPETDREERLPGKRSNVPLSAGDVISLRSPGGGGLGEPARRDPRKIEADLADGKVTPEAARREYAQWAGTAGRRSG
jgi:N-methylhydantoinase B